MLSLFYWSTLKYRLISWYELHYVNYISGGPCEIDEFQCNNGRCIRLSNVCDGTCDCGYSCDDENSCGK